ncbi:aminopeptidase [Aliidiomarina shirensis]|uniref:Aminopeptidase n=1 Tax=Aliidiomarina shirensis TaxID=1048642 RepID=A0A432WX10_9GAMM|nr:PDZ domain-containing protein [Aliidiomarina shirensis]RUO38314.1 aminopeptidase [Aliidiomarina shirensis]
MKTDSAAVNAIKSQSTPEITYIIDTQDLHHHYFNVTLTIEKPDPNGTILRLPAWLPGSYMIRDFAKNVVEFSATQADCELSYIRLDKSTWQISPATGPLTVTYRVYAFDLSVRTAWLDSEFGFFNPSALCLEVLNSEYRNVNQTHHQIQVLPPQHEHPARQWQLATGMPCIQADKNGFGTFRAESYAALIDYPFMLGALTRINFSAGNIPHSLVLVGRHFADEERLRDDLKAICEAQIEFWQGNVPFDNYQFLTMVVGEGFGGLEHRNSTALLCSRHTLEPGARSAAVSDEYLTFLSLCSHEYFHSWNIKQLRPKCFHPYDLQHEQYTEQLWFYEGITSYLDDYFVQQSGVMPAEQFIQRLGQNISRALRGKGPQRQSVLESSTLAWTTFYQQNENAQNAISSYYTKGATIALLIDLMLRQASNQLCSIRDVMITLYQGKRVRGTDHQDLIAAITEIGNPEIGKQVQQWLATTKPLPIDVWLEQFGIEVSPNTAEALTLQPGLSATIANQVALGAVLQEKGNEIVVSRVFEESAAALAGIAVHDRLVAIDFLAANRSNVQKAFNRYKPGERVVVHVIRDDQLFERELTWQAPQADCFALTIRDKAACGQWLRL